MSKKEPKAIVIDDNEHVLSVVAEYLKLNGFSVKAFGCSVEALNYLKTSESRHVDIIFTDFDMPRLNGLELIGELAKLNTQIPIIMISANGNDPKIRNTALKSGALYVLCKPLDFREFTSILESLRNQSS